MMNVLTYIKNNWLVSIIALSAALLAIAYILRFLTPEVPIQENSWKLVTPGYKISKNALEQLGTPLDVIVEKDETIVLYKSDIPILPHKIITDPTGVVQIIKETVKVDKNHTLELYKKQFGEPDIVAFEESLADSVKLYVFLSKGVAIGAHDDGGVIEEKWYFSPVDAETFLKTIGNDTNSEGHGPEPLPPEFLQ